VRSDGWGQRGVSPWSRTDATRSTFESTPGDGFCL